MKTLVKYLIPFAILIGASVVGAFLAFVQAKSADEGWNIAWVQIEDPPEKPIKVMAPYFIETMSGKKLHYNSVQCEKDCWQENFKVEDQSEYLLPQSDCGWYPDASRFVDSVATCERWGPGLYKTVWALDDQGKVWLWEKGMGEGGMIMITYSPYVGAFLGFLIGTILSVSQWRQAKEGRKKAMNSSSNSREHRPTQRAGDLGYAPRFLSVFLALGFFRFDGESTLPPQAPNAHR